VRLDPWALLVVRARTPLTIPNVVCNEAVCCAKHDGEALACPAARRPPKTG